MRKLPVDTSTFSELRTSNYVYVDKTEHMYTMITSGRRFFLSRPRRFGKSLLVSTFEAILTAKKELFDDLWIAQSDYQWQEYGVISFDFSKFPVDDIKMFQKGLHRKLLSIAESYQILIDSTLEPIFILEDLVVALYNRFGRVAILIDEYDSAILKTMHNQELAKSMRNYIQHFFTVIKGLDAQVQFVFITGVSSFAKAGLFSGINNLQILTLQDRYAAICGYTDQEVDYYFGEYIATWAQQENLSYDELQYRLKTWYDGYHFGENVVGVYNPFSVMNALNIKKFENFWFQSGTPTFLVEVLKNEKTFFDPQDLQVSKDFLGIFDVGNIPLVSLMFQTGYLTISGYDPDLNLLFLNYPNVEVKASFQKYLLGVYAQIGSDEAEIISGQLKVAFYRENIDRAIELIKQLFSHIPYQLHGKEEKFYHALLMMVCIGTGIKAQSEYSTSHGRIDLVIEVPKCIYIIEIKFNKSAEDALAQIEERRYYEPFIAQGKPLILLGLSFKREPHNFDVTYVMKKL